MIVVPRHGAYGTARRARGIGALAAPNFPGRAGKAALSEQWDNGGMNAPQPVSPRRRMQELLAIPDSQRTEAQWDELNRLEESSSLRAIRTR